MTGTNIERAVGCRIRALRTIKGLAAVTIALASITFYGSASAEPAELAGSWSGGGSVTYPSGSREKALCRATFSKTSPSSYKVSATCATASGKVDQLASVRRIGANAFSGNFRNADYNMEGTIHISVQGNSQNVTLTSSSASASLRLSR